MLGSTNTETARANWCTVAGRRVNYAYNSAGKVVKETYLDTDGTTVIFCVNYEYDSNGRIITQYCTLN